MASFSDEAQGEQAILQQQPDAVVSDIARGSDFEAGFTAAQRLRARNFAGPIVFFTARVTPERRERAAKLGAVVVTRESDVIRSLADALLNRYSGNDMMSGLRSASGVTVLELGVLTVIATVMWLWSSLAFNVR